MPYTESELSKLRRMTAETNTDSIYTDVILAEYLDEHAGDLYAAAAEVWDEKATAVSQNYDYEADGGKFTRSQMVAQYTALANKYRSLAVFEIDPEEIALDDSI